MRIGTEVLNVDFTLDVFAVYTYYRFRANEETREVHIRTGTDQEEIIGIKREWVHPWRKTNKNNAAYYDVVVQELGR